VPDGAGRPSLKDVSDIPPTQPELAEDDLQRSPEQHPDRHRETSAALQEAVAEVVATCEGRSLDEAIEALNDAVARRGHSPQPHRWVEAVAMDAIAGRTYVVNQQALDDTDVRVPVHDRLQQTSGRDRGKEPA
jgi:hypothetical protein